MLDSAGFRLRYVGLVCSLLCLIWHLYLSDFQVTGWDHFKSNPMIPHCQSFHIALNHSSKFIFLRHTLETFSQSSQQDTPTMGLMQLFKGNTTLFCLFIMDTSTEEFCERKWYTKFIAICITCWMGFCLHRFSTIPTNHVATIFIVNNVSQNVSLVSACHVLMPASLDMNIEFWKFFGKLLAQVKLWNVMSCTLHQILYFVEWCGILL